MSGFLGWDHNSDPGYYYLLIVIPIDSHVVIFGRGLNALSATNLLVVTLL